MLRKEDLRKEDLRKVPEHLASPIDNVLYRWSDSVCPVLRRYDFTPNKITTIGLVLGLVAIYLIYKKKYILGLVFLWLCFFTDCLDGHFARKYDMATKFGDYYDHFRDIFIVSIVIFLIYKRTRNKRLFVIVTAVFAYLMMTQIGCQEMNSTFPEHNDCLDAFKCLCPDPKLIVYTRFFGCGTFMLMLSVFLVKL
jgi:phosphatidylserine synthase